MSEWHNQFDHIYGRKPKTIGEAIECDINDASYDEHGALECMQREHARLIQILKVFADITLTDLQENMLGKALGYKRVGDE